MSVVHSQNNTRRFANMLAAVNPTSSGFGGGSYTAAGRPTAVGGAFSSPGTAAATPPGVPSSGIIEARNNKGSNVQIPYARLVPMHARSTPASRAKIEHRQLVVNGTPQLEYDGLATGELAWILGRRIKGSGTEMSAPERFPHVAMGHGVDRMQRLASTGWMESLFAQKLGDISIPLHELEVTDNYSTKPLSRANCLQVPDVAYFRAIGESDVPIVKRSQGLDVTTTSPFLGGVNPDSSIVSLGGKNAKKAEDIMRNLGDSLALSALEAELRKNNLMDWTPDGIVLSKLESPTDEPMKSTELDARQAQLFNVGVQGPSITTSWTSDVRDYKLEVQPLDRVFVCVVATVSYFVSNKKQDEFTQMRELQEGLINPANGAAAVDVTNANQAYAAYTGAIATNPDYKPASQEKLKELKEARNANDDAKVKTILAEIFGDKSPESGDIDRMKKRSKDLLAGNNTTVKQAFLSNFRLVRTTSSHMTNYSNYRPNDDNSRLGLKIGKQTGGDDDYSGVSDVIVGGWCIGTVVDSAASRSTIGFQTVKTHPTSMAINLNVNVQWWSGDKLQKHYMDTDGEVLKRGEKRKLEEATPTTTTPSA